MNRNRFTIIVTVLGILLSLYYLFPGWVNMDFSKGPQLRQGLDLEGGMYLKLEVETDKIPLDKDGKPQVSKQEALDRAMRIVRNRVDSLGLAEPLIQREGQNWIVVQLPGTSEEDRKRIQRLIGKTAQLQFKLVSDQPISPYLDGGISSSAKTLPVGTEILVDRGNENQLLLVETKILLTGDALAQANIDFSQQLGQPMINFVMTDEGAKAFAHITEENVQRRLAIVLDGVVQSAPTIRDRIGGGRGIIEGSFTLEEAKDLALVLRSGALPAPIKIINKYTVGATLGADAIMRATKAMALGTLLVILFMAVYYRGSGLVANLALGLNFLLIMGAMAFAGKELGAALTLPGIAGIVLTMGMAVDFNIIIFERIREEISAGKTVRAAIDAGYANANSALVDSAITSLIAAAVLIQFGTGPIKGFAITYSLGVVFSWFTALHFSKVIFDMRKSYDKLSI